MVEWEAMQMKVISGGGGIDADGNWYTLPTVEREVSDDWLHKLQAIFKTCSPRQPSVVFVSASDPAAEAIINRVMDYVEDRIKYLMAAREISYESAARVIMREIERGD